MNQEKKLFLEELCDIIRTNDIDSILIVGGLDHAYDLSQVVLNPINRLNIIYSTHPYPDKSKWGRSWDEAFGNIKADYPVFVTEVGFDPTSGAGFSEDQYIGEGRYRDDLKAKIIV